MRSKLPAQSPPVGPVLEDELRVIGERIRAHRRQQKVSATVAAEAAGLSRVTFHRIERGEPSVTMGAYLSAIDAVGLRLEVRSANARTAGDAAAELPERVRLSDHPELQRLAWQIPGVEDVSPAEALSLYERNWRHLDHEGMLPRERALLRTLTERLGGGRLLV